MGGKWSRKTADSNILEQMTYEVPDFPILSREWILENHGRGNLPWHWHSQVEFLYVEKGEITCCVNTSSVLLKEHECIFINSKESHSILHNAGVGHIKIILFPAEFIFDSNNHFCKECINPIAHKEQYQYIHLTSEKQWQGEILCELEKLLCYCENNIAKKMPFIIFSVCRIWEKLASFRREIPLIDPSTVRSPSQIRLQQMLSFIIRHYAEPITLGDIAGAANISQSEAARCFKKNLDVTPFNYLIQYRLEVAKTMLQSSEVSITEIAMQCGFESVSYFDRVFRKYYWLTPKEFRGSMDFLDDIQRM